MFLNWENSKNGFVISDQWIFQCRKNRKIRKKIIVHDNANKQTQGCVQFQKLREVVKTTTLEQDPPNHKIDGGVCLHPPCLTSKDGDYIIYPAVKNYSEIQTSLFLFV